jgi:predicted nucleotidyltransferase
MRQPSNYELGIDIDMALKPDQWTKLNSLKNELQNTAVNVQRTVKSTGNNATVGLLILGGSVLALAGVLYQKSGKRG